MKGRDVHFKFIVGGSIALCIGLAACSAAPTVSSGAPEPVKAIDPGRLYTGIWYEIARTPMRLTDGCVAGTTQYYQRDDGQLIDSDACRMDTPQGKEKSIKGPVEVLNPGENNKVVVHYTVYGIIPIKRTYWMLDHADDYSWFIESGPDFKVISLFTRSPRPPADEVAAVTGRAKSLGYDISKLEYPEEFPVGSSGP
jgi:apolipoprotein D and lipocalin family protein